MDTQTPNPPGQPAPTTPGKPASRQSPAANAGQETNTEEGQEIPKTARDPSEPIEQDVADDIPTDDDDDDVDDDDDDDDDDEDEAGSIELPGEEGTGDRLDGSRPAGNP